MMSSSDIPMKLKAANEAYLRREWSKAMNLLNEIITTSPHTPEGVGARLLRAMAHEFGNAPEGVDLLAAHEDYRKLSEVADQIGSAGLLGSARTMSMMNLHENAEEIRRACTKAIAVDGCVQAKMLLGYVALKIDGDVTAARRHYWSAFVDGSPWGLSYLAETFRGQSVLAYWAIKSIARVMSFLRRSNDRSLSPYHV